MPLADYGLIVIVCKRPEKQKHIAMLKNPWAVIKDPNNLLCGHGDDKK